MGWRVMWVLKSSGFGKPAAKPVMALSHGQRDARQTLACQRLICRYAWGVEGCRSDGSVVLRHCEYHSGQVDSGNSLQPGIMGQATR